MIQLPVHPGPTNSIDGQVALGSRPPTTEDWQRWRQTIVARYKKLPARMFICEMESEGLRVSEKMMRDHYRLWGINNKNQRRAGAVQRTRREVPPIPLEESGSSTNGAVEDGHIQDLVVAFRHPSENRSHGYSYSTGCQCSASHAQCRCHGDVQLPQSFTTNTSLRSPLHHTNEARFLHMTMKSLQDWSDSRCYFDEEPTEILSHANRFHDYLWDMKNAIRILEAERMCSQASVRRLSLAGVRLLENFRIACSPLAVLLSMQPVIEFKTGKHSDGLPWGGVASQFLLKTAESTFARSHPVLLLMQQLALGERDPEALAAIYEAGRNIIGRWANRDAVLRFQTSFFQTMFTLGLDAVFDSEIYVLRADASDEDQVPDARVLCDLADLHLRRSDFRQAAQMSRACLSAVQAQNGPDWIARNSLRKLASAELAQGDYEGAECSLRQALGMVTINSSDAAPVPSLSSSSMMVVDDLRQLYKQYGELEKYAALRLQHPSAFDD